MSAQQSTTLHLSGHRVEWRHDLDTIEGILHCDEPEWASCRTVCAEGCEEWFHVAPDGRTHTAPGEGIYDADVVHQMKPVDYCNWRMWIGDTGTLEECSTERGTGVHDGPVKVWWENDGIFWAYL